jgi:putative FmdB family regulatory protein
MTYDYKCEACTHTWEAEQGIKEEPLTICPKCGSESAKRQISAPAPSLLLGKGWYRDGYSS